MRLSSLVIVLCLATAHAAVPAMANDPEPKGSLVIIGGALRFGNDEIWNQVVDLAGGKGAKIAVFPTASGNPLKNGGLVVDALKAAGAEPFLVPVALSKIDVDYRQAVSDPVLVEQVRSAGGVFFIGGDQDRITTALRTEDGQNTPLLDAVWHVYRKGGTIAGNSAGAAIMSHIMYRDAESVLRAMQSSLSMGKEIDYGLGFIGKTWFVEQHCLIRGRFARALVAMHSQGYKFGIGVDENTALVVRKGVDLKVVGYKGAVVLDLSQATSDKSLKAFNLRNAKLTYLDQGDSINLSTLAVTPSEEKQSGTKIEPSHPEFHPQHDRRLVFNDILGNSAVTDLLVKLINNKQSEAHGLAFDGRLALGLADPDGSTMSPTPMPLGFEFRFYRGQDTLGWFTGAFGGEHYTVTNIHLDIQPLELAGPLFRPRPAAGQLATPVAKPKPAKVDVAERGATAAGN
jgi:cyanophycinase